MCEGTGLSRHMVGEGLVQGCEADRPVPRTMADGRQGSVAYAILTPTRREQERWHAIWLLAQRWISSTTAEALERYPHTIGFIRQDHEGVGVRGGRFRSLDLRAVRTSALSETQQPESRAAVQGLPATRPPVDLDDKFIAKANTPYKLPELPAPAGVCIQVAQEATAQGQ